MKRLWKVFDNARNRVTTKGKDRHGDNSNEQNLNNQPMFQIPHALQTDGSPLLFQAVKKIYESRRLQGQARANELLDAIIYIACAIIYEEEDKDENSN